MMRRSRCQRCAGAALVMLAARSSRRPTSRKRQPCPRVMFSISMPLNAARSVIMRFRCEQRVVELHASVSKAEVLPQLVEDPPGVDRETVADARRRSGAAPRASRRRRVPGFCLNSDDSSSLLERRGPARGCAKARRQQLERDEHAQQRRPLRRDSLAVLTRQPRDDAAQQPHGVLHSLGVASQPEQVVRHAARKIAGSHARAGSRSSAAPAATSS